MKENDYPPSLEEIEKKFMSYRQVVMDGKVYLIEDGIK